MALHTGVEYCLFVLGLTRASSQINVNVLHTFLYYFHKRSLVVYNGLIMDATIIPSTKYVAPETEVMTIQPGSIVMQSPGGGGSENPGGGQGF